jgi:hypothetical protein
MTRKLALVLVCLLFIPSLASALTVRNVAVPVKITDAALNALIQQQWSRQHWNSFSGTVLGCNYTVTVPPPTTTFVTDHATLRFQVTVTSPNCGGPYTAILTPTITIPPGQVTTAQVKLWLIDLYDLIQGLPVPQWVKDALVQELANRWGVPDLAQAIEAFPAPLLQGLTTPWLDQRSVNLYYTNPFELAWRVGSGFISLIPSVNLQAGQGTTVGPDFRCRLYLSWDTDWFDVWSNIKATVTTVRVFDLAGHQLYVANPGVSTIKYHGDPNTEWITFDLHGTQLNYGQLFIAWALFDTDDTFYLRKYTIQAGNSGWTLFNSGYNY